LKKEYEVRPYQPGDEEQIVELLELVFDGWPHLNLNCSPLDHWLWKYRENPLKNTQMFVGERNNRIIGTSFSVLRRIKIGNRGVLCAQGADNAIHPDFRRMGISKKLFNLKFEHGEENEMPIIYWCTENPILIKYYSRTPKTNIKFPFPLSFLVRIRDIGLHLRMMPIERTWLLRIGFHIVKGLNDVRNIFSRSVSKKKDLQISEISRFDDRIDKLWYETKDHYCFIVERTREYLNWRYCDSRGGDYIVKIAVEDELILGYSVLRINRYQKKYTVGYVVDLVTLPIRHDVVSALVSDAVKYFDSQNVNIILYLGVKYHFYERIFKRHGFLDSRKKPYVFYHPSGLKDKLNSIKTTSTNKVHFCFGDLDVI